MAVPKAMAGSWLPRLLVAVAVFMAVLDTSTAQTTPAPPTPPPLGTNGINAPGGTGSGINTAVAAVALPLGVSQILMAPGNQGSNQQPNGNLVPLYGASIAWSPTTTGRPRVAIGSVGAMTNTGAATVYGAVYVYDSEQFSFTYLQQLLPPGDVGSPGLQSYSRYGVTISMSQNSVVSPVASGTNMFVGQNFATVQPISTESVYFYSAAVQTAGLTRSQYVLLQTLRLSTSQSCNFGSTMALAPDDSTLIVGAPGASNYIVPSPLPFPPLRSLAHLFATAAPLLSLSLSLSLSVSLAHPPTHPLNHPPTLLQAILRYHRQIPPLPSAGLRAAEPSSFRGKACPRLPLRCRPF